jgi:hypothetical protein
MMMMMLVCLSRNFEATEVRYLTSLVLHSDRSRFVATFAVHVPDWVIPVPPSDW